MAFSKEEEHKFLESGKGLVNFCLTLTKDMEKAEELAQATMLRAWQKSDLFQPGTNMKAWLYMIARRENCNKFRKEWRNVTTADGDISRASDAYGLVTEAAAPDALMLGEVMQHISRMSAAHAESLLLVAEGFTYDEVAALTNTAVGTVKARVSRARANLAIERDRAAPNHPVQAFASSAQKMPSSKRPDSAGQTQAVPAILTEPVSP